MYTMHGAVVFFVSLDVRRYLPVVKCLAVLAATFGTAMIVLDVMVGMPSKQFFDGVTIGIQLPAQHL